MENPLEVYLVLGIFYAREWSDDPAGNPVVFVLNKETLARRHKIVLVDIYGQSNLFPELKRAEAEEFIVGTIAPLAPHIVEIQMQKNEYAIAKQVGSPLLQYKIKLL